MLLLKINLLLTLIQLHCVLTYAQIFEKFFRKDYTYFEATRSFYKVHTIFKTWQDAKKACYLEGTTLFYPEDKNEMELVQEFLKKTQLYSMMFLGASAILAKGVYETPSGIPVLNLFHEWAPGEPNNGFAQDCVTLVGLEGQATLYDDNCAMKLPFVCKKTLSSLQWNKLCNMPYTDYEYSESLDRCYKFHTVPLSWSEAYASCSAELSYLAVIDGSFENQFLIAMIAKAANTSVPVGVEEAVHVGFHNKTDEGWLTVKGVPLSDSGYSEWDVGEPNSQGVDKCGSMYYNGKLNDIACEKKCYYICEHDVEPKIEASDHTTANNTETIY